MKKKKRTSRQSCERELFCSVFLLLLTGDMQSPGNAGNWEPGNHAEMFHHLKPISCDKKNVLQDSVWLSDQKWRSGYTER